jgi:hypothetical protein
VIIVLVEAFSRIPHDDQVFVSQMLLRRLLRGGKRTGVSTRRSNKALASAPATGKTRGIDQAVGERRHKPQSLGINDFSTLPGTSIVIIHVQKLFHVGSTRIFISGLASTRSVHARISALGDYLNNCFLH